MSDATAQPSGLAVRASDADRDQTVALLQRNFADGRLSQAELEERAGAAYQAQTTAQLRDLTADLTAAEQPPRPGMVLDRRLLYTLLCVHPGGPGLLAALSPAKPGAIGVLPARHAPRRVMVRWDAWNLS
jgi:hypothetical protein